jgi:N-acetylmuramoyl-L-alanine amidase
MGRNASNHAPSDGRGRRAATLAMLWSCLALTGCPTTEPAASEDAGAAASPSNDVEAARADAWLAAASPLPSRSEVVALTDQLSIRASRTEDPTVANGLRGRAAALRERIWRRDRSATDAREAIELYGAVVGAAKGSALGCQADRARASVVGELAADAAATYRAVYLALERQASGDLKDDAMEHCVAELRSMQAISNAYRPTGAAWDALERDAASLAASQLSVAGAGASPTMSGAKPATSGSAAAATGPPKIDKEVVVVPDDSMIGKGRVSLTKVQPYSWELGARVVLHLSGPAKYAAGMLAPDPASDRGHRLYLDLERTRVKGSKMEWDGSGLVEKVRLGKRKGGNTRVVIDLKAATTRRVFYLPDPFRVVIDMNTVASARKPAPVPEGRRGVRRVTLDPGHGGWDAGAIGPTGLREKDVALDVAHRAAPALASELGIETMLTRDTDVFIELDERTARANAFQSDLFISVHCNATENGEATGVEVFILDPSKEQDRRALESVARENHGRKGRIDPMLLGSQLTNIAAGLGMRTSQDSGVFADLLRRSTLSSLSSRFPDTQDHGVKTAGFFVLVGASMPAVLFETSFISNPDDESRLGTADYRQKLADAIVNAVKAYDEGVR